MTDEEIREIESVSGIRGGAIVAARGTTDGVVLRLDGRVELDTLKEAMIDFVSARKSFLGGNEVSIEWVGKQPEDPYVNEIKEVLLGQFEITVKASKLREKRPRVVAISPEDKIVAGLKKEVQLPDVGTRSKSATANVATAMADNCAVSLFDGIESVQFNDISEGSLFLADRPEKLSPSFDANLWDEPDARIIYGTLRSGQKIETDHTLVVFGDVNSGAELIAGGDVIIIGNLRGVVHAGAYDENGGGRVIWALNMQPTQLRIGSVISRGTAEPKIAMEKGIEKNLPELARLDSNTIVVEKYHSKSWIRSRF